MYCLFVLLDLKTQAASHRFRIYERLSQDGIPFVMVFTKADKLPVTKVNAHAESYRQTMLEEWEALPPYFITSAVKQREGNTELMAYIAKLKEEFEQRED